MKIGSPIDTSAVGSADLARTGRAAAPAGATAPAGIADDQADISPAGAQLQSGGTDFDEAKVKAIQEAIRAGQFRVNPEAIADRLIADATALLSPRGA
jgi:negative regulator of flagellin synthesis FlgM